MYSVKMVLINVLRGTVLCIVAIVNVSVDNNDDLIGILESIVISAASASCFSRVFASWNSMASFTCPL